jgi:hypothetical protein
MTGKDDNFTMGLDRLNALLTWWGVPNGNAGGQIDAQMKRFQTLISDVQKAQGEAYRSQIEALFAASERVAGSLQEFAHCRQPEQVITAGSNVLATILESVSLQAQTWVDLAQKIQESYAEMARQAPTESNTPTNARIDTKRRVKASEHMIGPVDTGDGATHSGKASSDAPRPVKVA